MQKAAIGTRIYQGLLAQMAGSVARRQWKHGLRGGLAAVYIGLPALADDLMQV